jgi:hypothetical protein
MLHDIDYQAKIDRLPNQSYRSVVDFFRGPMVHIWCDKYLITAAPSASLLRLKDCGFEYIFDHSSKDLATIDESSPADRLVVIFGKSLPTTVKRDSSRMKGFIGRSSELGANTDKGHFMSHGSGGGLDINLYPQRRDFNQRRRSSPRSYVYFDMEKYTRENRDTFYFNRPIYTDQSWRPTYIEFGIVRTNGSLWIERFNN